MRNIIISALIFAAGALFGSVARDWVAGAAPFYGCVTIKGEKGRDGGGDGGDGIICRNGFIILPGGRARG